MFNIDFTGDIKNLNKCFNTRGIIVSKKLIKLKMLKILTLICFILSLFLLTSCKSEIPANVAIVRDDYATQVSNYNNFSYMVEGGGKIYFSRINEANSDLSYQPPDFDKVDAGIYAMDSNGDNIKKISDMYGRFLQVVNDKIYFNTWLPEKGLYRMNLDGTNLELIIDGVWLEFFVYEDAIYYTADMHQPFRKFDLKTSEISVVLDDFGAIKWIDNGYIYFSYDHEISYYYRMNLDTKEIQILKGTADDTPQRFSYDGERVYYSTYDSIHRIVMQDNSGLFNPRYETLVKDIGGGYNLVRNGGIFYYFKLSSVANGPLVFDLYRADEKGKKELLISGLDQRVSMYIAGGELYITQLASNGSLIKGYERLNFDVKTLEPLIFPED